MAKLTLEDFDKEMNDIRQRHRRRNGTQPGISPRPKLLQALRMRRGRPTLPLGGFPTFTPPAVGQPPTEGQPAQGQPRSISGQGMPIPFFPTPEKPTGGRRQ